MTISIRKARRIIVEAHLDSGNKTAIEYCRNAAAEIFPSGIDGTKIKSGDVYDSVRWITDAELIKFAKWIKVRKC